MMDEDLISNVDVDFYSSHDMIVWAMLPASIPSCRFLNEISKIIATGQTDYPSGVFNTFVCSL